MRPAAEYLLDPAVAHLNHGSFGAVPREVFRRQDELRRRMEANPHRFLRVESPLLIAEAREALAGWVGGAAEELVLVRGATEGVQTVVDALPLGPGRRVVTTAHEYSSVLAILRRRCARSGARLDVVDLPTTPCPSPSDAVVAAIGPDVAAVVVSHVTSPTALLLDPAPVVAAARRHGAVVVVDGAHGPGHLDLDVAALGADYYVGALHKWASCPRGTGFVAAPRPALDRLRPLLVSLNDDRPDPGDRFAWPGTADPTAWHAIGVARTVHERQRARGELDRAAELSARVEAMLLDLDGVGVVAEKNGRAPRMVTVRIPGHEPTLKRTLRDTGVWAWTGCLAGETLLRVSTAPYTDEDDILRLRGAVVDALRDRA